MGYRTIIMLMLPARKAFMASFFYSIAQLSSIGQISNEAGTDLIAGSKYVNKYNLCGFESSSKFKLKHVLEK